MSLYGRVVCHSPGHYLVSSVVSLPSTTTSQKDGLFTSTQANTSPVPTALTLQDETAALEQLKTLLREASRDQLLPEIQSQMNELAEQVRTQDTRLAQITREVEASVKAEIGRATDSISSMMLGRSHRDQPEEGSASAAETVLILRKLEHLASRSLSAVEQMRQGSSQLDPCGVEVRCETEPSEYYSCTSSAPWTVRKWSDCPDFDSYTLTLENCDDVTSDQGCSAVPEFTVLNTRDSYFTGGSPSVQQFRQTGHRVLLHAGGRSMPGAFFRRYGVRLGSGGTAFPASPHTAT
ncbi:hypothetical protein HPB50_018341 [Hyalomma asiaticum]|uniref:Uncharacterized protein n=1 Tax=Hyalomma asiaticum TaxID=266040 RepID=A0ACB7RK36_HYAAI|nr:hypothetical protein HPB50_018341 [Hyalomma asiaticum]